MELIGPYLAACFLLVAAGTAKVVRPDGTARALGALPANPLPAGSLRHMVRVGAALELLVGLVGLVLPAAPVAWTVAASYAAFAATVAYVRRHGGALASCGCFGTPDTPATALHLVVDLALCGAAVAIALAGPAGPVSAVLAGQPAHGVPLVVLSAVAAWLAYLSVSRLADLQAARALTAITFRADRGTPGPGPSR